MAKKLLLDATSKPKSTFGEFTRGYRQSDNVIDSRDGDGTSRARRGMYGSPDPMPSQKADNTRTPPAKSGFQETPDDYQTMDVAAKSNPTTPYSTRKVSPEEAVDATFNRRK